MKARSGLLVAVSFAALLVMPCAGVADENRLFGGEVAPVVASPTTGPDTYGLAHHTALMMGSYLFQGYGSATIFGVGTGVERYISTFSNPALAHPVLPNGALIEYIQLRACDSSATDEVMARLFTCEAPGVDCSEIALVKTGVTDVPGCADFLFQLPSAFQVNNQNPLAVALYTGTTSATTFSGVKLYYRLQVSPAPGAATFNDVPLGHPFNRFVEALAASGITAGCGGGNYCPDSPLTRGQMAVFLAAALGLHFPN